MSYWCAFGGDLQNGWDRNGIKRNWEKSNLLFKIKGKKKKKLINNYGFCCCLPCVSRLAVYCLFFLWSGTHEKYQICLRVFYFRFDKIIISFFFFHEIKNLFMHLEQAKVIPNRTDDLKINDDDVLFMICLSWTVEELFIAEQVQVVEICKFATKKETVSFHL